MTIDMVMTMNGHQIHDPDLIHFLQFKYNRHTVEVLDLDCELYIIISGNFFLVFASVHYSKINWLFFLYNFIYTR